MTPQDQQTYQRGATAALVGLIVQLVLAVTVALIGLWAASGDGGGDTQALHPVGYHFFGGLLIWAVLWLIYVQHRQERAEALEAEQLSRTDAQAAAIFEEHAEELQLARRRLNNLYKWGLGLVSVLVSVYLMVMGGLWLYWNAQTPHELQAAGKALPLLAMCAAIAFVAFITARWIAGMTREPAWQLLRGGASYMMGSALLAALAAAAALAHWLSAKWAFVALGVIVPALMVFIGVETIITFALGAYRPRRPGEIPRPAFDSRALGLLTSPESIAKAITDTINYQFGFEISRSWFYRLLSRAITPLIVIGALILIGISAIVIVEPHEQAVITRFGQMVGIVDPGPHLKWPWPIGRAEHYPVRRVQQVSAGSVRGQIDRTRAILWTVKHTEQTEEYLLTAAAPLRAKAPSGTQPMNGEPAPAEEEEQLSGMGLLAANVIVQFRVNDLEKFVRTVPEPRRLVRAINQQEEWERLTQTWEAAGRPGPDPLADKEGYDPCPMLTGIAARHVSAYFMGRDIDTILAHGRVRAGHDLQTLIQQDVAAYGIEIVFVSVAGIHPPTEGDVATAFHEQIGALQEAKSLVEDARREAIETLAKVAGTYNHAIELSAEIDEYDRRSDALLRETDAQQLEPLRQRVREQGAKIAGMLRETRGQARQQMYEAEAYRWSKELTRRGQAQRFEAMLPGYEQAPAYFRARMHLEMLAESLAESRKFLVPVVEGNWPEIWLDLKTQDVDYAGVLSDD